MTYSVRRFKFGDDEDQWNNLVRNSKNSTFLFERGFMDYHKDRFKDFSLIVYDEKDKVVACFPANQDSDEVIVSHSGLTYGSFILEPELKLPVVLGIFKSILKFYSEKGIKKIIYKAFPRIYNAIPSDEIDYCLFLVNAKLIRRDTALVIDNFSRINYNGNIRREAGKAKKNGIVVREENNFEEFWNIILEPNLHHRHGVKPVHSIEEITLLKNRFPNNIKLFTARMNNALLAGTVLFETAMVGHCQYISASDNGRRSGALNYLFTFLIDEVYQKKRYFDFGIANEDNGRSINYGLLAWKERMGGRTISHDFYEIETNKFNLIESS